MDIWAKSSKRTIEQIDEQNGVPSGSLSDIFKKEKKPKKKNEENIKNEQIELPENEHSDENFVKSEQFVKNEHFEEEYYGEHEYHYDENEHFEENGHLEDNEVCTVDFIKPKYFRNSLFLISEKVPTAMLKRTFHNFTFYHMFIYFTCLFIHM